jgi:hypothetical protein
MLVKELIEKLQELDPNLPVLAPARDYWDQWCIASEVRQRNVVQVSEPDDLPARFDSGGKPKGEWFAAIEIR